jgi:hypothetical protein
MSLAGVESRQSMRIPGWTAVGLLVVWAACATTSNSTPKVHAASGSDQRFTMVGSGFQTEALITPDGAQGPQINVGRYDNGKAIRGTANGQTIDLSVSDTGATGIWGQGPVTINLVESAPNELKVQGLIAGRPCTFTASKEKINGTVGFCSYDLTRTGETYQGARSCAGGIGQVTVQFPSTILSWKPINIAVLMALLMSTP